MKLCLIRHGDALFADFAQPGMDDASRPLSEAGLREARLAGTFLRKTGFAPGVVLHSPLLRAKQTAEGVAAELADGARLEACSGILPEDSPESFARGLDALLLPQWGDAAVVTHQPFVSALASYLLTGSEDAASIKFTTGTLACFERQGRGLWTLRLHVTSKAILRISAA